MVRLSDEQIWEIARAYSFGSDSVEGHKAIADAQLRAVVEDLRQRISEKRKSQAEKALDPNIFWTFEATITCCEVIASEYEAELEEAPDG